MNENLTFVIRNKYGKTYFAFTDPELGILFGEGTPSKTQLAFNGWWNMNKDDPLNLGIPYEVGAATHKKERATITCFANTQHN